MAEHRAVLKAIAAKDAAGRARRDAAAPEPGVQAVLDGLGHAALSRATPMQTRRIANEETKPCWLAEFTPRKTCGSNRSTRPTPGPGEVLLRLGAARHLRLRPPLLLRGPQRQLRRARAADPGPRGVRRRRGGRRRRHPRQGRRQGRGVAVARLRPLRLLPRGPRAPVHARCASSAARACFPHVQGMFQEYFVMGERQCYPVAGDISLGELAFAEPLAVGAARRQPRRRPARQVGADHRRRHDRLRDRDGGAARRRAQDHRDRRPRPAAGAGEAWSAPTSRCAPTATATRSPTPQFDVSLRGVRQLQRAQDLRGGDQARRRRSCRSARCRTSRCRSSSTS